VGIVAHGRSTPKAVFNALKAALHTAEAELGTELLASMTRAEHWLPQRSKKAGAQAPDEPEVGSPLGLSS
jgi:glycerol-3-phosphate acyltransferase PlsX